MQKSCGMDFRNFEFKIVSNFLNFTLGLFLWGTDNRPPDKRPQDRRPLRQKATERNVKMLLSCQDVLERLRVVLKTVEQIVLYVSSVLVCRPSLFVVYRLSVLVNCSTTATVCIGQVSPC